MLTPLVRTETKALLAQFRRNITSRAAALQKSVTDQQPSNPLASPKQQRHLQHVTHTPSSASFVDPAVISKVVTPPVVESAPTSFPVETEGLSLDSLESDLAQKQSGVAVTVTSAWAVNEGKHVEVGFANGSQFTFHTSWLKDAGLENFGSSFNRNCAHALSRALKSSAEEVNVSDQGSKVSIGFDVAGVTHNHEFDARWLHAFAPFVAKPSSGCVKEVKHHSPMLSQLTIDAHKSPEAHWAAQKEVPGFNCGDLTADVDLQMKFLEVMGKDGIAIIYDIPAPKDLSSDSIGDSLEKVVNQVVGAMYQPPRRKTNFGIMRANMAALNIGDEAALADYNFENPLAMHTDHAIYEETPGYLQWNWQAQASVTTKVCNGITVAEYIRATNPAAFKLLTTVHVTHAVRTNHYTSDGEYANSPGKYHEGTFEQMHTHPIIKLDESGNVTQVIHNELKRGVSAIPFDVYDDFQEAYALWKGLCEDPRFTCEVSWPEHSCVVLNNHFVLHGRATPVPGDKSERIMVWGYSRKDITENRYRLLKQRQLEDHSGINDDYTRNIPNQVMMSMATE